MSFNRFDEQDRAVMVGEGGKEPTKRSSYP